ncbi:MAG: hypothetical protein KF830_16290 [Planctomycetes bacterium]|nr:hypothetical protein [Planctomycetota bacterium]
MLIAHLAAGLALTLSLSLAAQEPGAGADRSPKEAFAALQAAADGQWLVQWHPATGTPSAIYGPGLPLDDWRENSLDEARRQAQRLLAEHKDLLGLGTSQWREEIGARMGRTWSLTFAQHFRGLPVVGGRADLRINMRGVLAMFGSRAWPIPADFDVTPTLGGEVATAIAWDHLRTTPAGGGAAAPRLCIWGDVQAPQLAPVFLAWEVPIDAMGPNGDGAYGRCYIDARTGAVLRYENDRHECGFVGCTVGTHARRAAAAAPALEAITAAPTAAGEALPLPVPTTVTVLAWTRTGNDAFSALVNTPLRGLIVSVPGLGNRTTDQNGQFSIDIAAPVTISLTQLNGTHFAPIAGSDAPSASVTVQPGVDATLQLLSAGATTNEAAHTTTAYWVDRVNVWARSILGNTSQLNTASNITPTVNWNSTCNATYGGNAMRFYLAGGGCSNTAFSTVIAHEWGHGLDDRYGGITNVTGDGLSEGWGDIIGMYLVDSNLLGSGFQSPGSPLRNGVNSRTYPQTGQSVHTAGQVWMGFAWDLRTRLRTAFGTPQAIAISNDIVIGSIVADAENQVDAVREVFVADDDDGNLLNGTPHYAQLSGAAIAKNLPYPQQVLATFVHTPLADTNQPVTPRQLLAAVTPVGGTINQVRVVYNLGGGNTVRNLHPAGLPNTWRCLLPGRDNGSVSYYLEAVHSSGEIVRHPASGSFAYNVDPAQGSPFVVFYAEGFETGAPGWTSAQVATQNDWQLGSPAGKSGTSGGVAWADPASAASGNNCYGNDLGNTIGGTTWNGAYAANAENFLRSPVIDCTGRTGIRLRFKRWLTVEDGTYDQARLFVNGVLVWQNPAGSHTRDTSWQTVEYAIPIADNNPAVQIEWRLKADGGVHLGGWTIDDVELGTRQAAPLDARLEMLPEQVVQGGGVLMRIQTQAPGLPWLLGIGDTPGPLVVPDFPTFAIGGNIGLIGGATDGSGWSQIFYLAPSVPSAVGTLTYTQVLTVDGTLTQWVVSNPFVNFFTQTP